MIFADSKTRGLTFVDTRLADPAKLHLLTARVVLAIAPANRTARIVLGQKAPARKPRGQFERSCFRTGFDFLKAQIRAYTHLAALLQTILQSPRGSRSRAG